MAACIFQLALFLVVFIAIFVQSGSALKCYECKSAFNGECDDVQGKRLPEEQCDHSKLLKYFPQAGSKMVCVVHKMPQRDEKSLSVVRGCAPDNYCAQFKDSNQCVVCEKDLCNASSATLPSIVLSAVSFLVFAKHYFNA